MVTRRRPRQRPRFPGLVERQPTCLSAVSHINKSGVFQSCSRKSWPSRPLLFAAASFAAVDVNKNTEAELDGLNGVGPAMSKRILEARKQGEFKDWPDLDATCEGREGEEGPEALGRRPYGERPGPLGGACARGSEGSEAQLLPSPDLAAHRNSKSRPRGGFFTARIFRKRREMPQRWPGICTYAHFRFHFHTFRSAQ